MWYAGIDAGSRTIKAVVIDAATGRIAGRAEGDQGADPAARAETALAAALAEAGLVRADIGRCVATGYARAQIRDAAAVTEITCHARGVAHAAPAARMVIDIGGQDSKIIWLEPGGGVADFSMNDRCAAGTGRYIEMVADRLSLPIAELARRAAHSRSPAVISSTCAVFAETELTGLLAGGTPREDLAAGVLRAVAARIAAMAGSRIRAPVFFTGGVARIPGLAAVLAESMGTAVDIAPHPLYTGAWGAALIAAGRGHENS